jgi:hypothetical protein
MAVEESRLTAPGQDERGENLRSKMNRAIKVVIEHEGVPSVGGFSVCLVLDKHGRNFWPWITVHANSQFAQISRDLVYGLAETGDFNYVVMPSLDAGRNFVAYYFRLSESALVFYPWDGGLPFGKVISDLQRETCRKFPEEKFQLRIWGLEMERNSRGTYEIRSNI